MITLALGEENNTSQLNWFLTLSGTPFNAFEVGFRILDRTAGAPGVQVFPAVDGTYEAVTNAPGRFATGSYYAYDNANAEGWTPPLVSNLGNYRIEWRWKDDVSSAYLFGSEDFVIASTAVSGDPLYISVASIRTLGIPNPPTDFEVESSIRLWQKCVERVTRQWYFPKTLELEVDGTDSDALHFGVPIISIDQIRINRSADALAANLYKVYNKNELEDRLNPRIKLVDGYNEDLDIFSRPVGNGRLKFRKGRQNQYIKGTFGYVEADGSVPLMIQRAVTLLVIEKITTPPYSPPDADPLAPPPILTGSLIEEWTDGHRKRYGDVFGPIKPRAPGLFGLTNNPEVLQIFRLYKAPIGIATPANPSFR
jgi:hypothetical protein